MDNIGIMYLFCLFILMGCGEINTSHPELINTGHWQVKKMWVNDSIPKIEFDKMSLDLLPNSRYKFVNNLNQTEAGTFTITDSLLILADTTEGNYIEKAMHILKMTEDSMILRLNFKQKESKLLLIRTKPAGSPGQ